MPESYMKKWNKRELPRPFVESLYFYVEAENLTIDVTNCKEMVNSQKEGWWVRYSYDDTWEPITAANAEDAMDMAWIQASKFAKCLLESLTSISNNIDHLDLVVKND